MKRAVVIHPRLTVYGGGEMVMLHVIKALQDSDYSVAIVTDNYSPEEVEKNFQMGKILADCEPVVVPRFKSKFSRFLALQRIPYAKHIRNVLKGVDADVAFSTQSILYFKPNVTTYHIVYDMADFFEILGGREYGPLASFWKKPYYSILRISLPNDLGKNRFFIPLSGALEHELALRALPHSGVIFPPCDMIFKIRPKKKQACLVSRIAPQKNIVDFMKIAGSLPNIPFILVGTHSELEPDYARKVMTMKPNNVSYFDVRIRDTPGLVEESKVYLYTSREPGIGIALGQAMGAGCIPVTPIWGGGAEMVARTGTGYTFRSIAEAAVLVRNCIEQEQIRDDPSIIAKHARIFSSSEFENQISHLLGTAKT